MQRGFDLQCADRLAITGGRDRRGAGGVAVLICNESSGDSDKDEKWTEIIGGMTIYKDAELKAYLEQAGFHDVQIHKKKSWLCITAWK